MERKNRNSKYYVTEDHKVPRSKGGSDLIGNLVGACFTCNNMRGTIPYQEFRTFIQLHGNGQPIREVFMRLTREEYLLHKQVYDIVRDYHYQMVEVPEDLFEKLRRPYLYSIRKEIEKLIKHIPIVRRQQIISEERNGGNVGRHERYSGSYDGRSTHEDRAATG
jgi:hypothetical protein